MSAAPSISIVIPAHNAAPFLGATLESIRAQTVTDWECIIVDDGSTDTTAAIAQRYAELDPRIRTIRQGQTGASAARNRGFRETHPAAQFVAFMDSDDLWLPDALALLREELERYPDAPAAHGLAELIDEQGRPHEPGTFPEFGRGRLGCKNRQIVRWPETEPTTFATLVISNRVFPQGLLLIRPEYFRRVKGFDEEVRLVEDWDMLLRLSRLGDIRFVNRVILQYRRHCGNISNESYRANRDAARMMHHRIFFAAENDERQKQLLRTTWRAWQSYLAQETCRKIREDLQHGRVLHAPRRVAQLYVQLHRYLRGYPTLSGL